MADKDAHRRFGNLRTLPSDRFQIRESGRTRVTAISRHATRDPDQRIADAPSARAQAGQHQS
ncbi:hypothetical protein [Nonomuraea indica]|uniref:Uncharacterized protein n=1 Tax=Nonomuraea indica TaxID=1581193 RepID=A0ABW7ZXH3_9ACTN